MRDIHTSIEQRLLKRVQAGNDSVRADLWISRPTVPLTEERFLERQVLSKYSPTSVSVAVQHKKTDSDASAVYLSLVEDGEAKVLKSAYQNHMESHAWVDTGFSEPAENVAICFDGTMPKSVSGRVEFVTEDEPWVFWVSGGKLYARKLNSTHTETLADGNCSAVSVVRSMWSEVGGFDFGIVAFFLLGGYLYYRQYIDNEWKDAELVSLGPSGALWSDIAAFRTWDYRIGVQALSKDGYIYELFTQYMGIGKQNTEHIEVRALSKEDTLTAINYCDSKETEHIAIYNSKRVSPYQGLYTLGVPSLLEVYNIDDENGNWGKKVVFVFDKELEYNSVQASIGSFYFTDTEGDYYFPAAIDMDYTGRRAILTFVDFNNAKGQCTAHYDPGIVVTMLEEVLTAQTYTFTPEGLVPNDVVLPEPVEIKALNEIGTEVSIRFSMPLVNVPTESAEKFIVTISYPEYSPGGALSPLICPVIAVEKSAESPDTLILHFQDGMETSIRNAVGEVIVQYIGTGITGEQGPVLGFLKRFIPEGLYMKPNPNDEEHISVRALGFSSVLTPIIYHDASSHPEHIEIQILGYTGILTHINDL